jgi:flagellar basal body-associated protein FliL
VGCAHPFVNPAVGEAHPTRFDLCLSVTRTIVIAVLVTAVILAECLLAYVLIPSRSDLESWSAAQTAKEHAATGAEHGATRPGKKELEVELGKYNIVIHRPAANMTLRVNFHLVGTIQADEEHEFQELLAKHQHRLRDQAIFEVRNSQIEDLTDPGLALLKRRILAKSNDLLGKPLLRSVVFSDFSFIEQ